MHHSFEDSADEYDADLDHRFAHHPTGRIILLGDGTEVLTDAHDAEMLDRDEEDKDLASQVARGQGNDGAEDDKPGPQRHQASPARDVTPAPGVSLEQAAKQPPTPEQLNSTSVPEKLFTPQKSAERDDQQQSSQQSPQPPTTDKPPEESPKSIHDRS